MDRMRMAIGLGALAAAGLLVYLLAPILAPFLTGLALAYLGNPLVRQLQAWRFPRALAATTVFLAVFLLLLAALLLVLPALQRQIVLFAGKLPAYLDWLQRHAVPALESRLGVELPPLDLETLRAPLLAHWRDVGGWLGRALTQLSRSGAELLTGLVSLALVPLVTFYLLRDWDAMLERIHAMLPPALRPRARPLAREVDEVLAAFVRGQLSVMLALAVVYSVGLGLVGLELALPIGMLAGLVSFVPYLGFIVGLGAAGLAALLQFQDPLMLVWVLAVFGVGQVLESFVLTPYLVGERLGFHPLTVIFAIMAGGQLFGFVGILLALPAAAALVVAVRHLRDAYYAEAGEDPARGPGGT